jgi:hypothetical protein
MALPGKKKKRFLSISAEKPGEMAIKGNVY